MILLAIKGNKNCRILKEQSMAGRAEKPSPLNKPVLPADKNHSAYSK